MNARDGGLTVENEGKIKKFVQTAEQITYPVLKGVRERGQKAKLLTECAVFDVSPDGLVLSEAAKGVDVKRDILDQMEFKPARIAEPVALMEPSLFDA